MCVCVCVCEVCMYESEREILRVCEGHKKD